MILIASMVDTTTAIEYHFDGHWHMAELRRAALHCLHFIISNELLSGLRPFMRATERVIHRQFITSFDIKCIQVL